MAGVVAGVVAALLLSATLFEGAANPWRALFAQTNGADIWLRLRAGTSTGRLAGLAGVKQIAGPYQATAATMTVGRGPQTAPVQLWAMQPVPPAIGRPLVRQGRWLTAARPRGVVLEASFAQAIHASTGSTMAIDGLDRKPVRATVAGIAYTSDPGLYPDQTPGLLLALFGLVAFGGALLAIGNAAGGRVLVQVQDLAMLKTLGFTPGQLIGMVVAEHAALAVAGEAVGIAVARMVTALLMQHVPARALAAVAPLEAGSGTAVGRGAGAAGLLPTPLPHSGPPPVRPRAGP